MNDTTSKPDLPDRLAGNPHSPFHVAEVFEHEIGIIFNGKERFDVEEYCISEGWVKITMAKASANFISPEPIGQGMYKSHYFLTHLIPNVIKVFFQDC